MAEVKLIPKLRFQEYSGDWLERKIGQVFNVSAGGDISKNHVSQEKTDIFKYPIYANAAENKGLYAYSDTYKIEPPVITVAGRGVNIGIAHARDHRFYPIVRLLVLKPKTEKDISFFEYRLNRINLFVESTGVPQLTAPQISSYKIRFPELTEQQKIASFLTAVGQRIQLLQDKKAQLETYKKGVMQKIFAQEIRFKIENEAGELVEPPDWEEKKLGELGQTFNGLTGKTKEDFGGGKPFIQYTQVFKNSKINIDEVDYVNLEAAETQNKAHYGDVFFTTSSETPYEVGMSSVLLSKVDELYLNSFCFGFRPNSLQELYPKFSQFLFRSFSVRKKIIPLAQGSTRYNMSKKEFVKLKIVIPSFKEQQKIASFLTSIDAQIEKVGEQVAHTEEFKKGLLQQLFV